MKFGRVFFGRNKEVDDEVSGRNMKMILDAFPHKSEKEGGNQLSVEAVGYGEYKFWNYHIENVIRF